MLWTKASVLGRSPCTVSRESTRNASRGHPYRACTAQTLAAARACQPRRQRKLLTPWLWQYLRTHLAQGCLPEQIAGRLRRAYPDDMGKQLLAETLYVGLYVLPRGTLRRALLAALRQARKARRPRAWGTDAPSAREGFTKKLRPVPAPLRKTLTDYRGKEMAEHERLAQRLAIRVSVKPVATWHQRTHEWVVAPIPAHGHRLVGLHAARAECHRQSPEHAPTNMSPLRHATGSLCATASSFTRCTWKLTPPRESFTADRLQYAG